MDGSTVNITKTNLSNLNKKSQTISSSKKFITFNKYCLVLRPFSYFRAKYMKNKLLESVGSCKFEETLSSFGFIQPSKTSLKELLNVLINKDKNSFNNKDQANRILTKISAVDQSEFQLIGSFDLYHEIADAFIKSRFNVQTTINFL